MYSSYNQNYRCQVVSVDVQESSSFVRVLIDVRGNGSLGSLQRADYSSLFSVSNGQRVKYPCTKSEKLEGDSFYRWNGWLSYGLPRNIFSNGADLEFQFGSSGYSVIPIYTIKRPAPPPPPPPIPVPQPQPPPPQQPTAVGPAPPSRNDAAAAAAAANNNNNNEAELQLALASALAEGSDILKAEGGKPFLYSMLCLVGEGRAGKTGLKNAMLGKSFESTESTIGMSQEVLEVVKDHVEANQSTSWKQFDRKNRSERDEAYARVIAERMKRRKNAQGNEKNGGGADAGGDDNGGDIHSLLMSELNNEGDDGNNNDNDNVDYNDATEQEEKEAGGAFKLDESLVMKFMKDEAKEPLKFTLWDFGGQEVFYTMHHLFLNRFGVYLVTFNMEWLVLRLAGGCVEAGKVLSPEERVQRCLDMIHFWLKSILLHTQDPKDGSSAPVFLVGTHKDTVGDVTDHAQISALLHKNFADDFPNLHCYKNGKVPSGRGVLWFYPVDNVKGLTDEAMRNLMEDVEAAVREEPYTKKKVPFEWLAVCDRLQAESRKSMRLKDFENLCEDCGIRSGTSAGVAAAPLSLSFKEEVLLVLKFFSNLGLIMYHEEPCLRDLVVTNPVEFLIGALTKFICNEDIHPVPEHREARKLTLEWKMLVRYGILDASLLKILWSSFGDSQSELELLMCKFGLVVPLVSPIEDGDGGGGGEASSPSEQRVHRRYLVPALLALSKAKEGVNDGITKKNNSGLPPPLTCHILFAMHRTSQYWASSGAVAADHVESEGFLPHGIFSRLVGKAVACSQLCAANDAGSNGVDDLMNFEFGAKTAKLSFGDHAFTLTELSRGNRIQVDIHVDNTMVVVETLHTQIQKVIEECVPNLRAMFAVSVGGSGSWEDSQSVSGSYFLFLHGDNGLQQRVAQGKPAPVCLSHLLDRNETLESKFHKWLPPSGLLDHYDIFISYRWGTFDSDLAERLFYSLSRENLQGCQTQVFLDKQRLQGGKNFVEDFMYAMFHTTVVVPLVSIRSLQRMLTLAEDQRDNVLVEWTLALELHRQGLLSSLHPILLGDVLEDTSPPSMTSLFTYKVNGVPLLDALPHRMCTPAVTEVSRFIISQGLEPTPELSRVTIRQTVKQMTDFLGITGWSACSAHGQMVVVSKPLAVVNLTKKLQATCTSQLMKIARSFSVSLPKTPPPMAIGRTVSEPVNPSSYEAAYVNRTTSAPTPQRSPRNLSPTPRSRTPSNVGDGDANFQDRLEEAVKLEREKLKAQKQLQEERDRLEKEKMKLEHEKQLQAERDKLTQALLEAERAKLEAEKAKLAMEASKSKTCSIL